MTPERLVFAFVLWQSRHFRVRVMISLRRKIGNSNIKDEYHGFVVVKK